MNMALNEGNNINFSKATKFFNATQIHPHEYYVNKRRSAKIIEERATINDQISSMVNHVHAELCGRSHNKSLKNLQLKTERPKNEPKKEVKVEEKMVNVEEKTVQTRLTTIDIATPVRSSTNIPKVKALRVRKNQERRFNSVSPNNRNNYEQQMRMKEILKQRAILESMLAEHKKLQRDRQSIVHEIHMMRNYLDDIRGRLDTSLKKLNVKSAISSNLSPEKRNLKFKNAFK